MSTPNFLGETLLFRLVDDFASFGRCLGELCIGDASYPVCFYSARDGVLDIGNSPFNVCIDVGAVLEGTVAFWVEGAILQHYIIHVAERLLSTDDNVPT